MVTIVFYLMLFNDDNKKRSLVLHTSAVRDLSIIKKKETAFKLVCLGFKDKTLQINKRKQMIE